MGVLRTDQPRGCHTVCKSLIIESKGTELTSPGHRRFLLLCLLTAHLAKKTHAVDFLLAVVAAFRNLGETLCSATITDREGVTVEIPGMRLARRGDRNTCLALSCFIQRGVQVFFALGGEVEFRISFGRPPTPPTPPNNWEYDRRQSGIFLSRAQM